MFSLLRTARTLALPIDIQLQLFHTLVTQLVIYGAEAWGIEDCTVIERLHLNFCKYILSLNKCTYTNVIYGETGEIPLSLRVKYRIVKYWSRLMTCQSKKLSYFIYKFIYSLHTNIIYHSLWILFVKQILSNCSFSGVRQSQTIPTGMDLSNNNILQRLRDQFIQQWNSDINNSPKSINFRMFKLNFDMKNYLINLPAALRIPLSKFRS